MSKTHSNDEADEDEVQLLASALGGSTSAISAYEYESSVLRDAKFRSAPQIVLPSVLLTDDKHAVRHLAAAGVSSSSSLNPCDGEEKPALPDLSSLAPSTSSLRKRKKETAAAVAAADVPHVLTVLSRTRDILQSTLSGWRSMCHDGDDGEDQERRRRREVDLLRMKEEILLTYLTDVAGLRDDDEIIPQRKIASGSFGRKGAQRRHEVGMVEEYY